MYNNGSFSTCFRFKYVYAFKSLLVSCHLFCATLCKSKCHFAVCVNFTDLQIVSNLQYTLHIFNKYLYFLYKSMYFTCYIKATLFVFTVREQERLHPIALVILNSNHIHQLLLGMNPCLYVN